MNLKLEYCKNGHEIDKINEYVYLDFNEIEYYCYKCLSYKIIRIPKMRGQILE